MELFIPDLCEVLKCRVKTLTDKKSQGDPAQVVAGISDVRSVLDEMQTKAEAQALEIQKAREEAANK